MECDKLTKYIKVVNKLQKPFGWQSEVDVFGLRDIREQGILFSRLPLYKKGLDVEKFITVFMQSYTREQLDFSRCKYNEMTADEIFYHCMRDNTITNKNIYKDLNTKLEVTLEDLKWIGEYYVRLGIHRRILSKEIILNFPVRKVFSLYRKDTSVPVEYHLEKSYILLNK